MGYLSSVGLLSIMLGLLVLFLQNRGEIRREMEIEVGKFSAPVWFLLMIFGLFIMLIDSFLSPLK